LIVELTVPFIKEYSTGFIFSGPFSPIHQQLDFFLKEIIIERINKSATNSVPVSFCKELSICQKWQPEV